MDAGERRKTVASALENRQSGDILTASAVLARLSLIEPVR